jgi:hypothetical protein
MRLLAFASLFVLASSASCGGKPTDDECRQAIANMQRITNMSDQNLNIEAEVRRCRSTASKATVSCLTAAKTEADLKGCEERAK